MSALSERQREELHRALLEYLSQSEFHEAYDALKKCTALEHTPDAKGKYAGLLEKKWLSTIRLQKKVRRGTYAEYGARKQGAAARAGAECGA